MTTKQKLAWDRGRLKGSLRMAHQALSSNTATTDYEKHFIEDILFSIESLDEYWDANGINLGLNINNPKTITCDICRVMLPARNIIDGLCPQCIKSYTEPIFKENKPVRKLKINYVQS